MEIDQIFATTRPANYSCPIAWFSQKSQTAVSNETNTLSGNFSSTNFVRNKIKPKAIEDGIQLISAVHFYNARF
jgi:hypothetical protein